MKAVWILSAVFFAQSAWATSQLDQWISLQSQISIQKIYENISPADSMKGTVVASPSKKDPDYYYHWVRDGALTMNTVLDLYQKSGDPKWFQALLDYVSFSRRNQLSDTLSGIGEPKFRMDGTPYNDPWARPQDDGPALRAITLTRLANMLLDQGKTAWVKAFLYDSKLPTNSVIKVDLEYVSHRWMETSFDLWEEVRGRHFYTSLVQRRALLEGVGLAMRLGDPGAALFYSEQASLLETQIKKHVQNGIILSTLDRDEGLNDKISGLDSAVLLGALHARGMDQYFASSTPEILATADALVKGFAKIYAVPSVIGRYPEDHYYNGNPWILTTLGLAETYYRSSNELQSRGSIRVTSLNLEIYGALLDKAGKKLSPGQTIQRQDPRFRALVAALRSRGDDLLLAVKNSLPADGSMAEQMDRSTGLPISARDLTWSYVSFLNAAWARANP